MRNVMTWLHRIAINSSWHHLGREQDSREPRSINNKCQMSCSHINSDTTKMKCAPCACFHINSDTRHARRTLRMASCSPLFSRRDSIESTWNTTTTKQTLWQMPPAFTIWANTRSWKAPVFPRPAQDSSVHLQMVSDSWLPHHSPLQSRVT